MNNIGIAFKNIVKHRKDYYIAFGIISIAMGSLIFLQLLVGELKIGLYNNINRSGFDVIGMNIRDITNQESSVSRFNYFVFNKFKDNFKKKFGEKIIITPIFLKKASIGTRSNNLLFRGNICGIESEFLSLRSYKLLEGKFFDSDDFNQGKAVVVISEEIKEKLFGKINHSIVNQPLYIDLDNVIYEVKIIGVLKNNHDRRYQTIFNNPVFTGFYTPLLGLKQKSFSPIPFITSNIRLPSISDILVKAKNYSDYINLREELVRYLHSNGIKFSESMYNLTNIKVQRLIDASKKLGNIFSILTLLTEVSVLTVIMVMVVRSRFREITIRKIEGAANRKIAAMFFWESIGVALSGGIIGIGIGCLFKNLIFRMSYEMLPQYALSVILAGFFLSIIVGIIASIIPATKAWRIRPVQGLKLITF